MNAQPPASMSQEVLFLPHPSVRRQVAWTADLAISRKTSQWQQRLAKSLAFRYIWQSDKCGTRELAFKVELK